MTKQSAVVKDERLGGWLGPWLMGDVNAATVCRTYGLLDGVWGPAFSYREYWSYGSWFVSQFAWVGFRVASMALAMAPVRWILKRVLPAAGHGPSVENLKNGGMTIKILAETDEQTPKVGTVTITGDTDPAYRLTGTNFWDVIDVAMMCVESALTLAFELEKTVVSEKFFGHGEKKSVVVTSAMMGEALRERLGRGGLHFTLDV